MGKQRKKNKQPAERFLLLKEENQEYARVVKVLGNARFLLRIGDKEIQGKARGLMRRRKRSNFVGLDSVVLVSVREYQDSVVDILHVYDDNEVKKLKKGGHFVEEVKKNEEKEVQDDDDLGFEFDDI